MDERVVLAPPVLAHAARAALHVGHAALPRTELAFDPGPVERVIKLETEAASVEELRDLVIAAPQGKPIRIRDVANVVDQSVLEGLYEDGAFD